MGWRLQLHVEDDRAGPRPKWRAGAWVLVVSLWICGVTVLAAWLAGLVVR